MRFCEGSSVGGVRAAEDAPSDGRDGAALPSSPTAGAPTAGALCLSADCCLVRVPGVLRGKWEETFK